MKNFHVEEILKRKANQSLSKYRISAIAFDKKGDVLGIATNQHSRYGIENSNKFMGMHAERILMERYGKNIKTIVIARIGWTGELRPVDPCRMCSSIAKKLGIKIVSICPGHGGRGCHHTC